MIINNVFGIKNILIELKAHCFCPIGKDWYTAECEIEIEPSAMIPDYCEIDEWKENSLEGKEMIVEAVVEAVYSFINEKYQPKKCSVKCAVNDAKHSAVTVIK